MTRFFTILLVEDDSSLREALAESLRAEGYNVVVASDGKEALDVIEKNNNIDLLILDIMLPRMSGYNVCSEIRKLNRDFPIIMLTAKGEEFDKVHGFEVGADDYITKPFSLAELLARISAHLRRRAGVTSGFRKYYEFGDFILNRETRTLIKKKSGKEFPLTKTEYNLMEYFCEHPNKVLSREELMKNIWGSRYFGTQRSLDSYVVKLRNIIEVDSHNPHHIITVYGIGYKFQP